VCGGGALGQEDEVNPDAAKMRVSRNAIDGGPPLGQDMEIERDQGRGTLILRVPYSII
jgi:hypothetical protein